MGIFNIKLNVDDILSIIGDTPEVRLEITSSIAQDFAKRYLKPLVNDDLVAKVKKNLQEGVDRKITDQIGSWKGRVFTPSESIAQKLQQEAEVAIRAVIDEKVAKAMERQIEFLDSKIQSVVNNEVTHRVQAEVERRMKLAFSG